VEESWGEEKGGQRRSVEEQDDGPGGVLGERGVVGARKMKKWGGGEGTWRRRGGGNKV